jgi:hypothetical protein
MQSTERRKFRIVVISGTGTILSRIIYISLESDQPSGEGDRGGSGGNVIFLFDEIEHGVLNDLGPDIQS